MAAQSKDPDYALLGLAPVLLFLFLNTYYLALEQSFRISYDNFVRTLHEEGGANPNQLYLMPKGTPIKKQAWISVRSVSIWLFYLALVLVIGLMWQSASILKLLPFSRP